MTAQRPSELCLLGLAVALCGCQERPTGAASGAASSPGIAASASPAASSESRPPVGSSESDGWFSSDGLAMRVTFWKREVLVHEPILAKIEFRNDSAEPIAISRPYPSTELRFGYWREDGERVPNPRPPLPQYWPGPPEYALGDWGARHPGYIGPRIPAPPVCWAALVPGECMFAWADLLQFLPLDDPGRYRVGFEYVPRPESGRPDPSQEDVPAWRGTLNVDAGWITVREPKGQDAKVAGWIRAVRDSECEVLSSMGRITDCLTGEPGAADVRTRTLAEAPRSAYAVYAEGLSLPVFADASRAADEQSAQAAFLEKHPGFPVLSHPETREAREAYIEARRPASNAWLATAEARSRNDPRYPTLHSEALAAGDAPEIGATREEWLRQVRATGDLFEYIAAQTRVWRKESWTRSPLWPGNESQGR